MGIVDGAGSQYRAMVCEALIPLRLSLQTIKTSVDT